MEHMGSDEEVEAEAMNGWSVGTDLHSGDLKRTELLEWWARLCSFFEHQDIYVAAVASSVNTPAGVCDFTKM